jgi:hypothetical protein
MRFCFIDVILLRSGHQHVSANSVAICRVVRRRRIQLMFEQDYK